MGHTSHTLKHARGTFRLAVLLVLATLPVVADEAKTPATPQSPPTVSSRYPNNLPSMVEADGRLRLLLFVTYDLGGWTKGMRRDVFGRIVQITIKP
jgi:hypothetical protein